MNDFYSSTPDDLIFFIKKQKYKKIFILCGKKSYTKSGADKIINKIINKKNVKFFFKNSSFPDFNELKNISISIKSFSPDLIIAIGGGSVIDYAKIANVIEVNNKLKLRIINSTYKIEKKFTKLLAIPTTAGSGAEVTSNAVIYIDKIKYSIEGEELKPNFFFLLPELIIGSSNKIKSASGFDAISQAIESLISKKSNLKSIKFAKKSLNISLNYYLDFLKNPNQNNTAAMCFAANLSGKAISISKTTAPHAVSYPFTSLFNISHGHAVSLTINKFLTFNYKHIKNSNCSFDLKERYNMLFKLTGSNNINQLDKYISNIKKQANLEDDLKKLGIDIKKNYSKIISGINLQRLSNNPIDLKKKDIKEILF